MDNDIVFIAKLQQALTLLDEIDDIISNNPEMQQNIDWEISDYLHLLENSDDLPIKSQLEIMKELKKCRLVRKSYQKIYIIGKIFNENRGELVFKNSRNVLKSRIKERLNTIDEDYKYRVLDKNTLVILKTEKEEYKVQKRKYTKHILITKEELEDKINNNMGTNDIAKFYNVSMSYICYLKNKYGIATRKYKKRG